MFPDAVHPLVHPNRHPFQSVANEKVELFRNEWRILGGETRGYLECDKHGEEFPFVTNEECIADR